MQKSGETSAVILVKAAPQVGRKHGETVCCAGIEFDLREPIPPRWLRLYPISFRKLEDAQKFARWDIVQFRWHLPRNDPRKESRRVEHESLRIIGALKKGKPREDLLTPLITHSLKKERQEGKSLALLSAEIEEFFWEKKPREQLEEEAALFKQARAQQDLFASSLLPAYSPCPYIFKYRYRTEDGRFTGTCQDWETDATYFRFSKEMGERKALERIYEIFGQQYPEEGMLLAMGTHSRFPETWLINGVIKFSPSGQAPLL